MLGPGANWEEAAERAWKVLSPSNCRQTGGRLLISTLHATANSISGIHRKTELSFFEWFWEETLSVTGETKAHTWSIRLWVSDVKILLWGLYVKDLIVRIICEGSACESHMWRILLWCLYVKVPIVRFIWEESYCETHLWRIVLWGQYLKHLIVRFICEESFCEAYIHMSWSAMGPLLFWLKYAVHLGCHRDSKNDQTNTEKQTSLTRSRIARFVGLIC